MTMARRPLGRIWDQVYQQIAWQSVETIIPRRIDRCPECDSEKTVFPEAGAGTARTDLGESIGAVPTVAALGSRAAAWWWSRETGSNPEPSDLYVWPL
jgi:hypothetical protein